MGPQHFVSVVMPCLDEAGSVGVCVHQARAALADAGLDGEVIVADNGSSDTSAAIASEAGAEIVHVARRGYGAAYLGGLAATKGDVIVMGDADGTYDFAQVPAMVAALDAGLDMVLGDRFAGGMDPRAMPWLHRHVG